MALIEAEKSVTENFVREKENGQIKGLISNMWLILLYTVKLFITKLCIKILGQVVPEISLTEKKFTDYRQTNM